MTLSIKAKQQCSVTCPRCKAKPSRRCLDASGNRMQGKVHIERAVALHAKSPGRK